MRERFRGLTEILEKLGNGVSLRVPTYGQRLRELCTHPPFPSPRWAVPILTVVIIGYAGLVKVRPHWASDLNNMIESLVVGK